MDVLSGFIRDKVKDVFRNHPWTILPKVDTWTAYKEHEIQPTTSKVFKDKKKLE